MVTGGGAYAGVMLVQSPALRGIGAGELDQFPDALCRLLDRPVIAQARD